MPQNKAQNIKNSCGSWAAAVLLVAIMVCLGACSPEHTSYSDFSDLPDEGWDAGTPIYLTPQYGDSTMHYDVTLAVRNTNLYKFDNLILTVDLISASGTVTRNRVVYTITDAYGNFQGSGFGAYYQSRALIAHGVSPAQVKRIAVWPRMKGVKLITGLTNIGIIVSPTK